MFPDVSRELTTSILMAEETEMEAGRSCETFMNIYRTAKSYIPGNNILH
jgi:hypothetical protein